MRVYAVLGCIIFLYIPCLGAEELRLQADSVLPSSLKPLAGTLRFPLANSEIVVRHREGGHIDLISGRHGAYINLGNAGSTGESSKRLIETLAPALGLDLDRVRIELDRESDRPDNVLRRFKAAVDNVPVYGGEILVSTQKKGGGLSYVLSTLPQLPTDTAPIEIDSKSASRAAEAAVAHVAEQNIGSAVFVEGTPEVVYFDARTLGGSVGALELAWRVLVTDETGHAWDIFWQPHTEAIVADIPRYMECGTEDIIVYDGYGTSTIVWQDGSPAIPFAGPPNNSCNDTNQCDTAGSCIDDVVNVHYPLLTGIYDLYCDLHARNGMNESSPQIKSHVRSGKTEYGGGHIYFAEKTPKADDIVGHEYTHGVTFSESLLIYSGESGAMNESFSDIWGEAFDLLNGYSEACLSPNPEPSWLIGDGISGLPARSLIAPETRTHTSTAYDFVNCSVPPQSPNAPLSMPNRYHGYGYYMGTSGTCSKGFVHHNSSVSNKLFYLLSEGTALEPDGIFNSRTFEALDPTDRDESIKRALELFYYCQLNMANNSDFADLYAALQSAVTDPGCTWCDSDSEETVEQACKAVQINVTQVLHVPTGYATIQAAINAASSSNSLIKVAQGTYNERINFNNKNIILTSENPDSGAVVAATIIDGSGIGYPVTFAGSETRDAMITGFTIRNGYYGGIVSASGKSDATVSKNVIRDNDGSDFVYGIRDVDGIIEYNDIFGNYGTDSGAAIRGCDGIVRFNDLHDNEGALYSYGIRTSHGTIIYNLIRDNSGVSGRGVHDCDGTVEGNFIYGNSGSDYGYGLRDCGGNIRNNFVYDNDGVIAGRGVYNCTGNIEFNTIYSNSHYGIQSSAATTIKNNIIWGHATAQVNTSTPTPSYCCIQSWSGGGTGNITSNPNLVNPGAGDYTIPSGSPCVDTGGTSSITQDFENESRPFDGNGVGGAANDIGADEYHP